MINAKIDLKCERMGHLAGSLGEPITLDLRIMNLSPTLGVQMT